MRPRRRLRPVYFVLAGILAILVVVGVGLALVGTSKASLVPADQALARIQMPMGGGTIQSVTVVTGPHSRRVPVVVRDNVVYPQKKIWAGRNFTVDVVIKRPSWISWLTGKTQHLELTVTTPVASLSHDYITVASHAPLRVAFDRPVSAVSYGPNRTHLRTHRLSAPSSVVTIERSGVAGSVWISGIAHNWESTKPNLVSWFPSGAITAAVASPAPGSTIRPDTQITLTFSKPISKALGASLPPVTPSGSGSWHQLNNHAIVFRPEGYGYGLGATVKIALPAAIKLFGGTDPPSAEVGTWKVPPGSSVRLQQLLANLGYLPLSFKGTDVPNTTSAQEGAAVSAPKGTFSWRYSNTPSTLRNMWKAGAFGVMTKGAVMAFEDDHGMVTDGVPGPAVWKALIAADVAGKRSTFGYTFVMVSEGTPESLTLWHSGKDEFSVPVNTGIPEAPTALGTYPVFEHVPSTTMSGTNPDGSHYSDPGIPWVSYFNGGDALHGFLRAQYGLPQSLGCVEMSYPDAGRVYPYTPIGTLVNVA